MATTLKNPSILAVERKLDPSDALFFAGNWDNIESDTTWEPVGIREKSVRGTISNRLKTKEQDPAKLDAAIEKPNPQTVDICTLPTNADTLKTVFSLRILEGTGQPSSCNSPEYRNKLTKIVNDYTKKYGFEELARRYACNLANGRFLWRNRIGAEDVKIQVDHMEQGIPQNSWEFSALDVPLPSFTSPDSVKKDVEALGKLIAQGLCGEKHVLLQVTAFVRVGNGLEVYPSQELIMDRGRGNKSKTLYAVENVAAIHSQKIGNAIRTIDDWYPDAKKTGPIAVEPYGAVTTQGKAYRQPKEKTDFYSLLDNWMLKDIAPDSEQQHYVMAVLIRGGVFGAV